jgi:hypothetical protein
MVGATPQMLWHHDKEKVTVQHDQQTATPHSKAQ